MSPPNGVVIKQGISALDLALSFVAPATGRAGRLVLTGTEQSSNKKIPPRTILAVFNGGKVSKGTEGVPWVFTKPKKVWIVDTEGQKPAAMPDWLRVRATRDNNPSLAPLLTSTTRLVFGPALRTPR